MKSLSILPILILALPLITSCSGGSTENKFVNDAEPATPSSVQEAAPWQELEAATPPWPNDSDLAEVQVSEPSNTLRFMVDTKHLSIGKDQIVRYTLVVKSPSGAENVSFEGIRCTLNGAFKVYAYGSGNSFKPAPEADWRPVGKSGPESYRDDLWRHHFCVRRSTTPRPLKEVIRSLKTGVAGRDDTQLMAD